VPRAKAKAMRPEPWKAPRWLAVGVWSFFTAIWIALAIVLVVSPEAVDELWSWIGEQPTALQLTIWVVFLPVMVAIAVWESSWALWIRLAVLALCVVWTTWGFNPRRIARSDSHPGEV
jgi:hypothetical protein